MKTAKRIEALVKQFLKAKKSSAVMGVEKDKQILDDALAAFEKSKPVLSQVEGINTPAEFQPGVYEIFKSRTVKFAIAAIIVIAAVIIVNQSGRHYETDILGRAIEQINNSNTLIYNVSTKTNNASMPIVQTRWMLKKPGTVCVKSADGCFIIMFDTVKMQGVGVLPAEKKYIEMEMTNIQNKTVCNSFLIAKKLKSLSLRKAISFGREQTEGKAVEGFCFADRDSVTKIWIDCNTLQIVLLEIEFVKKPAMTLTARDFKINEKVEEFGRQGFEKMPIRIDADVSMVNERDINGFLDSLIRYRDDGGIFPSGTGRSDLAKIACLLSQKDMPVETSKYWANVEIACP